MSTPEWKAYLDGKVFIKSSGRIDLIVRFHHTYELHSSDRWEWSVVDQVYKHVLIDWEAMELSGAQASREEAMLAAENAAKELAQALMPLLGEKG